MFRDIIVGLAVGATLLLFFITANLNYRLKENRAEDIRLQRATLKLSGQTNKLISLFKKTSGRE